MHKTFSDKVAADWFGADSGAVYNNLARNIYLCNYAKLVL